MKYAFIALVASVSVFKVSANAASPCPATHGQFLAALKASVSLPAEKGMVASTTTCKTLVARDGTVCAVAFSGSKWDDQWPRSRLISAQTAYPANAFSLSRGKFSTVQMYANNQPGGFLRFGGTWYVQPDLANGGMPLNSGAPTTH